MRLKCASLKQFVVFFFSFVCFVFLSAEFVVAGVTVSSFVLLSFDFLLKCIFFSLSTVTCVRDFRFTSSIGTVCAYDRQKITKPKIKQINKERSLLVWNANAVDYVSVCRLQFGHFSTLYVHIVCLRSKWMSVSVMLLVTSSNKVAFCPQEESSLLSSQNNSSHWYRRHYHAAIRQTIGKYSSLSGGKVYY